MYTFSALLLAVLAVLACAQGVYGKDIDVEEAKDAHVYTLTFSESTTTFYYSYEAIDKKATLSFIVYPDSNNIGTVTTSLYIDKDYTRQIATFPGFINEDFLVYNSSGEGTLYGLDLTEAPLYFKIESNSSAIVNFVVMSSIILINYNDVELSNNDPSDDYDYEKNDYKRYFRAFNCLNDSATANIVDSTKKTMMYVYGWNPSNVDEPGRPDEDNCSCKSYTYCNLKNLDDSTNPGWVFITVDVKDLFEQEYVEEYEEGYEEEFTEYTVIVSVALETPDKNLLTTTNYLDLELGMYKGCTKLVAFRASDWDTSDSTEEEETYSLEFIAMSTESYNHGTDSLLGLATGEKYPVVNSTHYYTVANNVIEYNNTAVNIFKNIDLGYISIFVLNPYDFPQPNSVGEVIDIHATMLKNATILNLGVGYITVTLKRTTENEGCGVDVDYARLAFDAVGVNRPYYATTEDAEVGGEIIPDYVIVTTNNSSSITPDLHMGIYTGAGGACVPYRTEISDETDVDNINTEYLITSKTYTTSISEEVDEDITYLVIKNNSASYHEGSAYILDIYNTNLDTSEDPQDVVVNVVAHPRWLLRKNLQYNMVLNGNSRFDFFVVDMNNLDKGLMFSIETTISTENEIAFNIYASFSTPTPGKNARFKSTGYGKADLFIDPEDLEELRDMDDWYVYIAIDTQYSGEVLMLFTEGNSISYSINDSDSIKTILTTDNSSAIVRVHSTKLLDAKQMLFYFDASSNDWDNISSDTKIDIVISTELVDELTTHESYTVTSINSSNQKVIKTITISNENDGYPDYFVYLVATYPDGETEQLNVVVFAEKMTTITPKETNIITGAVVQTPLLSYLNTKSEKDYTIELSITNLTAAKASYNVRICAGYPSISEYEPPDVDNNNIRNCLTKPFSNVSPLEFDLIGDSIYNDGTITNDLAFILNNHKYITVYPVKGIPLVNIKTIVYEDDHIRTDDDEAILVGVLYETSYFRLHIVSADSTSPYDMLRFEFSSENPVDYCLSTQTHAEINAENCVLYHISESESDYVTDINQIVKITDINKNYDSTSDAYLYFSYAFPAADDDNIRSLYTLFTNNIIHYLNPITSSEDDIDKKSYFFTLYQGKNEIFYTNIINLSESFRFFIMPDVTDGPKMSEVNSAFSNSVIGIKMTTSVGTDVPIATTEDNDLYGAGIILKDYVINKNELPENSNYVIVSATFINERSTLGLYKAGFLSSSNNEDNPLLSLNILDINKTYHYTSGNNSGNTPSDYLKSTLYYYPHATSKNLLAVYPCAGVPGIYQSYINPLPTMKANYITTFPSPLGYTRGRSFKSAFIDANYDMITHETGFVFNASVFVSAYNTEDDPFNKLRWDADFRLITSDSITSTGGPQITNSAITLVKQRGSEVVLTVQPALPTVSGSRLEYAVFVIPAVGENYARPNFDASPETYCGLMNFGFPLTVDTSNNNTTKWKSGDNSSSSIKSTIRIVTNYKPSDYKYSSDIRPNYYDPREDSDLSSSEKSEAKKLYNVNIVVREVKTNNSDGSETVIGYNSYKYLQMKISGDLPITEEGLFAWEVAIIVIVIVAIVGAVIGIVIYCLIKKKKSMEYQNVDGQGAPEARVLPEDQDIRLDL